MKGIAYKAQCEVCGWESGWFPKVAQAQKAAKTHTDDNPNSDYDDVPLWDGPMGTGAGSISNI